MTQHIPTETAFEYLLAHSRSADSRGWLLRRAFPVPAQYSYGPKAAYKATAWAKAVTDLVALKPCGRTLPADVVLDVFRFCVYDAYLDLWLDRDEGKLRISVPKHALVCEVDEGVHTMFIKYLDGGNVKPLCALIRADSCQRLTQTVAELAAERQARGAEDRRRREVGRRGGIANRNEAALGFLAGLIDGPPAVISKLTPIIDPVDTYGKRIDGIRLTLTDGREIVIENPHDSRAILVNGTDLNALTLRPPAR